MCQRRCDDVLEFLMVSSGLKKKERKKEKKKKRQKRDTKKESYN